MIDNNASLVIINAKIWTGDSNTPRAEAAAIKDDKFIAVGSQKEIEKFINEKTEVIDAKGNLIVPGLIDSHIHFIEGGFHLASVQLRDASTPKEFIERIKSFANSIDPGTWITGGDWDHELWGGELPRCDWIDSVSPGNPVWISRLDGHMALANSLAMKLAGVDKTTKDIKGGTIVRYENGEPTGLFKDNAMYYVGKDEPYPSEKMIDRALTAAMNYVASLGVTSIHHMGSWGDIAAFSRAYKNNKLITRIYSSVPLSSWSKLKDTVGAKGTGDAWLKIGGLKGFVDGSLGSHTAAFFEPFIDSPSDSGLLVNSKEDLYEWISNGDKHSLQILVHAIGDRAISMLLDIYKQVIEENGKRDRRFRIEHAQHIHPKDFIRFKELSIIPSMQPYHTIDDGRWAEKVIGPERIKTTYAFRTLLDYGVKPAFGSDWYVAPPSPMEGIYAAVTRRTIGGKNPTGWVPEQKISVEEALRAYTSDAAFASFDEEIKGVIKPGLLTDFVVLDKNIFEIPPEEIVNTNVVTTFVGGKKVYPGEEKN